MISILALNFIIHRCDQKDPPTFESQKELEFVKYMLIEQGVWTGKTMLAFTLTDPITAQHYYAQIPADDLRALLAGVEGSEKYWATNPVKHVWKK